ncbi:MAG: PEGA domain-containing protein [Candidatus Eisenbacteria bacterium]
MRRPREGAGWERQTCDEAGRRAGARRRASVAMAVLRASLLACAFAACVASLAAAQTGTVAIATRPSGIDAWAGERYLGKTPLEASLPPGPVEVRLVPIQDRLFQAPVVDTLLQIVAGETVRLDLEIGVPVRILSVPYGLRVLRDGAALGRTPLSLRVPPGDFGSFQILTPEGVVAVPRDSLATNGSFTWRGASLVSAGRARRELPAWRRVGRYLLPGLAVGLAAAGAIVKDDADESYRRYERATDPARIGKLYDEASRRDRWAVGLWIGAEVSLASAVFAWILPEGNGRAVGEPEARR